MKGASGSRAPRRAHALAAPATVLSGFTAAALLAGCSLKADPDDGDIPCAVGPGCCSRQDSAIEIDSAEALADLAAAGCSTLDGNLSITAPEITDVEGLETIQTITGDLEILSTDSLESLQGLDNLGSVGGSLIISANEALSDLSALAALSEVGAEGAAALVVVDNAMLATLEGLAGVTFTLASITIYTNEALETLQGLNGVTSVQNVAIVNNVALTDISGLSELDTGTSLRMDGNDALERAELPALRKAVSLVVTRNPALTEVTMATLEVASTEVTIDTNDMLQSIDFSSLQSVGMLAVANNPVLETLNLEQLEEADSLAIVDNESLPQCAVDALDGRLGGVCNSNCTGNDGSATCD